MFQPDQIKYPGLKPSTFRPHVWLEMLGEEQTPVRDFIYKGYTKGFRITAKDVEFDTVEYENARMDLAEEREAVNKTVGVELAAGCIALRPSEMFPYICNPVFPVPKKAD